VRVCRDRRRGEPGWGGDGVAEEDTSEHGVGESAGVREGLLPAERPLDAVGVRGGDGLRDGLPAAVTQSLHAGTHGSDECMEMLDGCC